MKTMKMRHAVVVLAASAMMLTACGGNDKDSATPAAPSATGSAPATTTSAAPAAPADNGVAKLEPDAILAKAKAALTSAKSFRMKGSVAEDKQTIGLDFKISGKDVVGTMTMNKAKVELLRVGKQQFIRPDQAFWKMTTGNAKQAESMETVMNGRWAKLPAGNKDFAQLFSITDVNQLLKPDGKVVKGDVATVAGQPAVALKTGTGSDEGSLFVATTGEPYPLKLSGATSADGGITFGSFGEKFSDLKLPAASAVVDLSKLQG